MIRHWVDALDDRNPVYLDEEFAATTRFGGIVAPPAMLNTWLFPRPQIDGIGERRGQPTADGAANPLSDLDAAGYVGTLMTNTETEYFRYLRPGDHLTSESIVESISEQKTTGVGRGYFVSWVTTYYDQDGEAIGRQLSRIFKFDPAAQGGEGR